MLKNNINKLFIISLSVLLVFTLSACNNENDSFTNNPEIEDVKDAIESIEHISSIEIVTEENDPNGNLGKDGGYTGALFFLYDLVENDNEESALEAGTSGGGSIEVYETVEDAEKRDAYLEKFDGLGILSSGSHTVLGTIVIRTSKELTASQQQALEDAIIEALKSK